MAHSKNLNNQNGWKGPKCQMRPLLTHGRSKSLSSLVSISPQSTLQISKQNVWINISKNYTRKVR